MKQPRLKRHVVTLITVSTAVYMVEGAADNTDAHHAVRVHLGESISTITSGSGEGARAIAVAPLGKRHKTVTARIAEVPE